MSGFYAPKVEHYRQILDRRDYGSMRDGILYDEETYRLLEIIFDHLKQIAPYSEEYGVWHLWVPVERGPVEAYGSFQDWLDDGCGETYEEFLAEWRACFPDEVSWYQLSFVERPVPEPWRSVHLRYGSVIQWRPKRPEGFPLDIHAFTQWVLDSLDECIAKLRAGTYNTFVAENLPAKNRTGTVLRKDVWKVYPDRKAMFFENITEEEIRAFIKAMEQADNDRGQAGYIPEMTANDFYRLCAMGYAANNYPGAELTPREQYYRNADGRDDGLKDIDPDSPEAFLEWLDDRQRGGHPFEVCRGGNSTHISLYVHHDENSYSFLLVGEAWTRTVEIVKFYLALREAGIPVEIHNGDLLAARLTGEEKIGVVPDGVIPAYRQSDFPGEDIIDFMNLPFEDGDLLVPYCVWKPEPEVRLAEGKDF